MAGFDIEIILSRQWADCLSIPVFIVDPIGDLKYYNEAAEEILGKRFSETGPLKVEEWSTMFNPFDEHGNTIPPEKLPLVSTLTKHVPAHKSFWIESLQREKYKISVTAFPIIGRDNQFKGAIAIFWT